MPVGWLALVVLVFAIARCLRSHRELCVSGRSCGLCEGHGISGKSQTGQLEEPRGSTKTSRNGPKCEASGAPVQIGKSVLVTEDVGSPVDKTNVGLPKRHSAVL